MRILVLLLLAPLFISCENSTSVQEPELGEVFKIQHGQRLVSSAEYLSIQFDEVKEDSRCPKGLMCVWSGNAQIKISLNGQDVLLNTHLEPKRASVSSYNVELINLNPYPEDRKKIQKEEYVAELLITK